MTGLDLIIGGHSHSFLYPNNAALPFLIANGSLASNTDLANLQGPYPTFVQNPVSQSVPVVQAFWASRYSAAVSLYNVCQRLQCQCSCTARCLSRSFVLVVPGTRGRRTVQLRRYLLSQSHGMRFKPLSATLLVVRVLLMRCRYLGRFIVEFDVSHKLVSATGAPILLGEAASSSNIVPDANTQALIDQLAVPVRAFGTQTIGSTQVRLDGDRADVRSMETNLGNVLASPLFNVYHWALVPHLLVLLGH